MMNTNDLAILVLASIFLVVFAIASTIMLYWEIRHSRTRDEAHKAQMREMIDKIEQLINSIKSKTMDTKNYLTGATDPTFFLWCLFFAGLGILFVLLMGTKLRDPLSQNSPQKFSWSYLWSDNLRRILASILAVYLSLRFMPDLLGWDLNEWKALMVGTAWDGIALFLKQKTNWLETKK